QTKPVHPGEAHLVAVAGDEFSVFGANGPQRPPGRGWGSPIGRRGTARLQNRRHRGRRKPTRAEPGQQLEDGPPADLSHSSRSAEIDHDILDLRVVGEGLDALLPAEAAAFVAAKRPANAAFHAVFVDPLLSI